MNENLERFEIGATLRSHDFIDRGNRPACYIEGVLVGYAKRPDCERYEIRVGRVVTDDEEDPTDERIGQLVYPPLNGTPLLRARGGVACNVERVS